MHQALPHSADNTSNDSPSITRLHFKLDAALNFSLKCPTQNITLLRLLVARAYFNGALIPGKLHAGHTSCYVAWNGQEHPVPNYEVLVAPPGVLRWVPSTGGYLLANAVLGGHSENGEQLLVGRAYHAGTTVPGKVHPSHRVCYIPYGGQEIPVSHYDVLMR
ncbi:unnamed protein product [Allacma fusca]|uniref:Uncharacterized protein n=1 Tax=Allacma fusca TaxID=39272 RepID=A0A8J2JC03_9HEXA|nr:unnamed protein product [Allacma fusca]